MKIGNRITQEIYFLNENKKKMNNMLVIDERVGEE